jgi:hypothetical protein
MRRLILYLILLSSLFPLGAQVSAQDTPRPKVEITSPLPGEALQGLASITGNTAVEGFFSSELTFSYAGDPTKTWFLLHESYEPIAADTLFQWDTNTISDGNYDLRLTVYLDNGKFISIQVPDIRVRNYTPIETNTPTETPTTTPVTVTPLTLTPEDTPTPTVTASPPTTPVPVTNTPLPPNPAELFRADITNSLARGAAGVLAVFLLIGLYLSIKRIFRKK